VGVYIPIEMPKNCRKCPMLRSANEAYGCSLESGKDPDRFFLKAMKERPEWCQLKIAGKE
jgi:hypothetical protein